MKVARLGRPVLVLCLVGLPEPSRAANPTDIQIEVVVPVCGNSVVEQAETCDPPGASAACPAGSTCTESCVCSPATGTGNVSLQPGLNLVSIPLVADDTRINPLLSSIAGSFKAVFGYDPGDASQPWGGHAPGRDGFLNDLFSVDPARGFWIDMTQAATLAVSGVTDATVDYTIREGWNLISYPALGSAAIGPALANVSDSIVRVYRWDAAASTWTSWAPNDASSTLGSLDPGYGYLVEASQDDLWRFEGTAYRKRLADLEVVGVRLDPPFPGLLQGGGSTTPVGLEIVVRNDGDRDARDVEIQVFDVVDGVQVLLATYTFELIAAGETVATTVLSPVTFPQTFDLEAGEHQLLIRIDPADSVAEESVVNNEAVRTLEVQPAFGVSVSQSPSAGCGTPVPDCVPIAIDFGASVTGGVPPYQYIWQPDQTDTGLSFDPGPTLLFSNDGQRTVELSVTDARGVVAVDTNTFTLGAHPSTLMDFQIAIDSITPNATSANRVDIDLRASNTSTLTYTGPVRVTVTVFDRDDPAVLSEVVSDELRQVFPAGASDLTFQVTTPQLPDGNYTAKADINPFGAIGETNHTDNGDTLDFTISGSLQGPPLEVTAFTVDPLDATAGLPMVGMLTAFEATVANNGPTRRSVAGLFYYTDPQGVDQRIPTSGSIATIEPGDTGTLRASWLAAPQTQTQIRLDVVDLFSDIQDEEQRPVRASHAESLTIGAYDFELTPNSFEASSGATTTTPVHLSAEVRNLSPVNGSVAYTISVDGSTVESGAVNDLPAGAVRTISAPFRHDTGGEHSALIELQPFFGSSAAERAMYESNLLNDFASGTYQVTSTFGCAMEDLSISPPPVFGRESLVTVTFSNFLQDQPGLFDVEVRDRYKKWFDGTTECSNSLCDGTAPDHTDRVDVPRRIDRVTRSYSWIPKQTGCHALEIQCANDTVRLIGEDPQQCRAAGDSILADGGIFVAPKLTVSGARVGDEHGTRDKDSELESGVGSNGRFLSRLKLWTFASWLSAALDVDLFDNSVVERRLWRQIMIDDGTNGLNAYTGDLLVDMGWTGVMDKHAVFISHADYSAQAFFGIEPHGTESTEVAKTCATDKQVPCRSHLFSRPVATEVWADRVLQLISLIPKASVKVVSLPVELADTVLCDATLLNTWKSRPREDDPRYVSPFRFEELTLLNRTPYDVYIDFRGFAKAGGLAANASVDFFVHEPHTCAVLEENGSRQNVLTPRGIWLDDVELDATAVGFHP